MREVVLLLLDILSFLIFARVLLSWLPMAGIRIDPYNPAIRLLYSITDPILEPLRRYTMIGMMDFSPVVAIVILNVLRQILSDILR